ncbi:MAG: DUF5312 domain-containing protein [Spirochaetaceae bacterium]|nr:DUF5312 domain-containing protein [Spirochaetaceae bacterium]
MENSPPSSQKKCFSNGFWCDADNLVRMDDNFTFNKLSFELTDEEREVLLEKLSCQEIPDETLYEEPGETYHIDIATLFQSKSAFYQFILRIIKWFTGREPYQTFLDREIGKIGKKIKAVSANLYDTSENLLLSDFLTRLTELKNASRFFYAALQTSLNRNKSEFYAFLGALELPDIHRRLLEDAKPENLVKDVSKVYNENELKQNTYAEIEDAFASISDSMKSNMYTDSRELNCLMQLASFPFDRILNQFKIDKHHGYSSCEGTLVIDNLQKLENILYSVKKTPSTAILETMFAFVLQNYPDDAGYDIDAEILRLRSRTELSLKIIKDFNSTTPVVDIIRCISRNLDWQPSIISGGEDWQSIYKEYWKDFIRSRLEKFLLENRKKQVWVAYNAYFNDSQLKALPHIKFDIEDTSDNDIQLVRPLTLTFLLNFSTISFVRKFNPILEPLLIGGEFIRRDNRLAFTESYNTLVNLASVLARFDLSLAPEGEFGSRVEALQVFLGSPSIRRGRLGVINDEINIEALKIIRSAISALKTINQIIEGILKKDTTGRFDTITNLSYLTMKHKSLIHDLGTIYDEINATLKLMNDIETVEIKKNS